MKIAFMGTPQFARTHLEVLAEARDDDLLVVTQPDRPTGRGKRVQPPPVAVAADALGLPLLQPESTLDPDFLARLADFAPDLLVIVAYRLLPDAVLAVPRICPINVHPSLLPRYRGAAPIPRALMNGETRTGVTIIRVTRKMDSGDIIARRATTIGPDETCGELSERLAGIGSQLLVEVIGKFESGAPLFEKQEARRSTLAPRMAKTDALVDWAASARTVHNLARAMNPKPLAYSFLHRSDCPPCRLGILRGQPIDVSHDAEPGTVLDVGNEILVACGEGAYAVAEVTPAGKRPMSVAAYLAGNTVRAGDVFRPTEET